MSSFTITPVEAGVMRCRHTAEFTHEDVRALARFLEDYSGKLLVDLRETTGEQCARHLKQFRPMMPTTAVFGAALDPEIFNISESYYTHDVKYFASEEEALIWLRSQE